jgi:hypothetical protein
MTTRISTGLRNYVAAGGSYAQAFQNGRIEIYSGAQPATADAAVTGTLLCTLTDNAGSFTAEVQATGTVTLTGGASGSVDTVTVGGYNLIDAAVAFNTSLTQTATDLAAAINNSKKYPDFTATSSGAVVTIKAPLGMGTVGNSLTVTAGLTTITASYANTSGGVSPVNGLKYGTPVAGVLAKLSSQTWSGVNAASGTAGYFRQYGSVADAGGADATETVIREDGAIATSGSQLNMTSTSLTAAATTTLSAWSRTFPAA